MGQGKAAVLGIVDLHGLAGPIHKHLFAGVVLLAQHRFQGVGPALIELAESAIAIAFGVSLAVFLPQQLQGHPLSPKFLVNRGPVRRSAARLRGRNRSRHQPLEQLLFAHPLRQRPRDGRRLAAREVIADGARRQTTTAGNFPDR